MNQKQIAKRAIEAKKHWAEKTAKKDYNCFKCNKPISKGSTYFRSGHRFVTRVGCSKECHDTQDGHWK